jgi:hypothetical protein
VRLYLYYLSTQSPELQLFFCSTPLLVKHVVVCIISSQILILPGQNWNFNFVQKILVYLEIPVLSGQNWNSNFVWKNFWSILGFQFGPAKTGIPILSQKFQSILKFQFRPVKIGILILSGQILNLTKSQFCPQHIYEHLIYFLLHLYCIVFSLIIIITVNIIFLFILI